MTRQGSGAKSANDAALTEGDKCPTGIPFTQYLMPFGERRPQWIDRPADIEDKARAVIRAGGRFEVEMLRGGEISFEVVRYDGEDTESVSSAICANGPAVLDAVDKLVTEAFAALCTGVTP